MRAKVLHLHCPDIDDLENFVPASAENFGLLLQIIVGPKGGEGEESFDVEVYTPKWLDTNYSVDDIIIGKRMVIVQKYDYQKISTAVKQAIEKLEAPDWCTLTGKISRIGAWEFEDYIP